MTFNALAKALLRRQLRQKLQPKHVLHATPPEFFVEAYTHCASCQRLIFADTAAEMQAIRSADTVEQFVEACQAQLLVHDCPAKHAPKN
jgi:hypothetical protein